jgi:hypothetical protein
MSRRAMLRADVVKHRCSLFGIGNISREKIAAYFRGDSFGVVFVARVNDDLCPFTRKSARNRQANVMGRAGYQCDFIFEGSISSSPTPLD